MRPESETGVMRNLILITVIALKAAVTAVLLGVRFQAFQSGWWSLYGISESVFCPLGVLINAFMLPSIAPMHKPAVPVLDCIVCATIVLVMYIIYRIRLRHTSRYGRKSRMLFSSAK